MGKRELHLCDVATPEGVCDSLYYKTCPLCDTECCTSHFGTGNIYLGASSPSNTSLGSFRVDVCKACAERLVKIANTSNPLQPLIDPLRPKVVEMIRAALAATALAKTGDK